MRRFGIVFALAATFGCGSSDHSNASPPAEKYSGIMPAEQCAPGTRPRIGQTTCAPVGTTACPDGFRSASSGWGCEAIAADGCTGSDRAVLGNPACVPVDDCSAPFPPPDAAAVVTDSASLASALASAPAGATIALDAGEYSAVTLTKSVNLIGRCAKDVIFRGPGERGLFMQTDLQVSLQSLTVREFQGGVVASYGPSVSLSKVILAENTIGLAIGEASGEIHDGLILGKVADTPSTDQQAGGVLALYGAKIDVNNVEMRDERSPIGAYDPNTVYTVKRSIIGYTGPVESARLVSAYAGANLVIEESLLRARNSPLVSVGKELPISYPEPPPPAEAHIRRSVLQQSGANLEKALVHLDSGAHLELADSTLAHQAWSAIEVGDPGSSAALTRSVIQSEPTSDVYRSALFVTGGASAELDTVAVISAYQNGLLVAHPGSQLTIKGSLVHGTQFRGPGPNAELGGSALAVGAGDHASLVIQDSALVENTQFSLFVDSGATLDLQNSLIDKSLPSPLGWGEGLVVGESALLASTGSMVRGSADAALAAVHGGGKVDNTAFLENAVVVEIDGSRLVDQDGQNYGAGSDLVFNGNVFFQNGEYVRNAPFGLPLIQYH